MLSVFSDSATPEIKSHYAFRIFGEWVRRPGQVVAEQRLSQGTMVVCSYCKTCWLGVLGSEQNKAHAVYLPLTHTGHWLAWLLKGVGKRQIVLGVHQGHWSRADLLV